MRMMSVEDIAKTEEFRSIVEDYRGMCFWFMADDWFPNDKRGYEMAAENLEHYGDMRAYRKAGEIRQWLLQPSSRTS